MPFRGFLNSWAADANAIVFKDEMVFCRSSSSQNDMSLIVVITSGDEEPLPASTNLEKTYSFLFTLSPFLPFALSLNMK